MSLDVYLYGDAVFPTDNGPVIFIRDNGQTRRVSREKWDHRFPGQEPVTFDTSDDTSALYESNITHNLGKMARAAGVYECCWRPEENGIIHAHQLIEPLAAGLARLRADPPAYRVHNPENGWGNYEGLVAFVEGYLLACRAHPSSTVSINR